MLHAKLTRSPMRPHALITDGEGMRAVAVLLAVSVAGCSFFADRGTSPTDRPSCEGLEQAVLADRIGAGVMGATAVSGIAVPVAYGGGGGNGNGTGGLYVLGITVPAVVIGVIYLASSSRGSERIDSCHKQSHRS
jgi:hypothetical protein